MASSPARTLNWIHIALLFIAVLCFVLAFFKVGIGGFELIPAGLAFGFAAFLPWWG